MPFTEKQRRFFHAAEERGEPGMKRLAEEADAYAKAGKEKPPVKGKKKAMSRGQKAAHRFIELGKNQRG